MWNEVLGIAGNIPYKMLSPISRYVSKLRQKCLKNRMKLLQDQFENPALYKYLMYKYPTYPLLKRNNKVFPVVVFPQDSLGFNLMSTRYKVGTIHSSKYRKFKELYDREVNKIDVEKRKKEFSDVDTYTMLEFDDNNCILHCGVGQYDDVLDSCDALEYELLRILAQGYCTPQIIDRRTSLRNKLHSLIPDPIRCGKERVCGLGISCLLAFKDKANLKMLLLRRSPKTVAIHSGLKHCLPSGMFQSVGNLERDLNAKDNILKEYAEELFNLPNTPKGHKPLDIHTYIQYYKPVIYLEELLKRSSASLTITGLAVNLINLRPEICLLLFINDPQWWDAHTSRDIDDDMRFKFNDEILKSLILAYSDYDADLLNEISPERTIPPGAAAFWLGIDRLRQDYL